LAVPFGQECPMMKRQGKRNALYNTSGGFMSAMRVGGAAPGPSGGTWINQCAAEASRSRIAWRRIAASPAIQFTDNVASSCCTARSVRARPSRPVRKNTGWAGTRAGMRAGNTERADNEAGRCTNDPTFGNNRCSTELPVRSLTREVFSLAWSLSLFQ